MKRALKASSSRIERHPALQEEAKPTAGVAPGAYGTASLFVIAVLAGAFALYFGRELLLPLVFALVLRLLLAPAQRLLTEQARLPAWTAAIALVLALFVTISLVTVAVSVPGARWLQKAPGTLPALRALAGTRERCHRAVPPRHDRQRDHCETAI